jgi:hypothetical protein
MPWAVVDCAAYRRLSHGARTLLWEFARQCIQGRKVQGNNGRLLASRAYLATRGWKSARTLDKCKRELIEGGFIFETVKGHHPNKASWYAVTWRALDNIQGYDAGAAALFERGAYAKNAALYPKVGTGKPSVAPNVGPSGRRHGPEVGAISPQMATTSVPPWGHHLEMPSPVQHEITKQPSNENHE